jgi:hypothetical protein
MIASGCDDGSFSILDRRFAECETQFSVHVTSICIPSFCLYVMSKLFLGIKLGRNGFAVLSSESFLIEVAAWTSTRGGTPL